MPSPLHLLPLLLATTLVTSASTLRAELDRQRQIVFGDHEEFQRKKSAIKSRDHEALADYRMLLNAADKALDKAPLSVTHKETTPPSGSKHDYLSLAPYWWPNPDTADGLPWIRKDGQTNPETRGEHTDVDRKSALFSRVHCLGMAAYYSEEPRYAAKAVELLETWFVDPETRMNPNLEFAQGIPGRNSGRCFGIIEWVGFDRLLTPIQLLRTRNAIPPATDKALTQWFSDYLTWLQTSEKGREEAARPNNHATWYDVQVSGLLLFLDRPEEARRVLEQVKAKRIATQIEPDGRQPHELARTKSLSYSKMNLRAFTRLAKLGEQAGVDLWNYESPDGRSIRKAQSFLAPYLDGRKKWPYQQLNKKDQ